MDLDWPSLPEGSQNVMNTDFQIFPENETAPTHSPDIEEVTETQFTNTPPLARKGKTRRPLIGRKLANFSVEEDRLLISCWLDVSTDPIVGTGQRAEAYWKRVHNAYEAHRGQHSQRTQKSLNNRWDTIKENVSHFAGFHQQVLNRNQSGLTYTDKTSEAITMFSSIMHRPFTMAHCWDMLKNEVKWIDLQNKHINLDATAGEGNAAQFVDCDARASNSVSVDRNCSSPATSTGKRPMGRDQAKEVRKKASSSSNSQQSSSQFVSGMQELQLERFTFMKNDKAAKSSRMDAMLSIEERKVATKEYMLKMEAERINIEQKRLELMVKKDECKRKKEEQMEEERILAIDLSKCNPAQKVFYKARQDEILARIDGSYT